MTSRETATVLAALRLWQEEVLDVNGIFGARNRCPDHFADVEPLNREEVDRLCEELNFEQSPVKPREVCQPSPEQLARLFHEIYEDEAPRHCYKTREASAKLWEKVPENNRNLMVETCRRVIEKLFKEGWPEH